MSIYGYCPICGAECKSRERRLNGNDHCKNGHCYPSKDALKKPINHLTQLQYITSAMASYLGHTLSLFGMELAGEQWTDGADYSYFPKNKKLADFTEQDCINTLIHIHEWLSKCKD